MDPVDGPALREYTISEGRFLRSADNDAAVIPTSLATSLGLKVGDTLRVPTTEGVARLAIVGLRAGRPALGNEEVIVTLNRAQKLLDMPGLINAVEANYATTDTAAREAINQQILGQLGRTYVLNAVSTGSEVFGILQTSSIALNMFGVLTLFMGAFIIFNTFRTIVAERRHDIGMLRAIGASRGTIVGLILTEGLVQGIVGSAIGIGLGYLAGMGIASAISGIYQQVLSLKMGSPVVQPGLVFASAALGIGVTLFAGLLPAVCRRPGNPHRGAAALAHRVGPAREPHRHRPAARP